LSKFVANWPTLCITIRVIQKTTDITEELWEYLFLGAQQKSNLKDEIGIDRKDLGRADSLRYTILSLVVDENYDRAMTEIREFTDMKKNYPRFQFRTERYSEHCMHLIRAIKAKRRFPGYNMLASSKQQELKDMVMLHFRELIDMLKRIEAVDLELQLDDLRSTVWVVKSGAYVVGLIVLIVLVIELNSGLWANLCNVTEDVFAICAEWLLKLLQLA
jgi:hypothetical protein